MIWWRITKYNPVYRNEKGYYLKDEWTDISDVGTVFDGTLFTIEQYFSVEEKYIKAIILFMECTQTYSLEVKKLEKRVPLRKNEFHSNETERLYDSLREGIIIPKVLIPNIVQLLLRSDIWCMLESEKMIAHFGYDYYMYIGSELLCEDTIIKIQEIGLFPELIKISPHCKDDDDDDEDC